LFFALCRADQAMIDLVASVTRPEIRALAHQAQRRWRRLAGDSPGPGAPADQLGD
jgi:hypothetical protein